MSEEGLEGYINVLLPHNRFLNFVMTVAYGRS